MPTCLFGWWRNTTRMWTSTTSVRAPRSRCRGWCPLIASDAAIVHILGQNGAGIHRGDKARRGAVRRADVEFELAAGGHALERGDVQVEIRRLSPGGDRPVWLAPEFWRLLHERQLEGPIVEDQGDGGRRMNIAGWPVISGRNVDPQAVAQGAAAIPFDRSQVGEAGALAQNLHRVLRARQEFNRLLERTEGHCAPLVQYFHGLGGGLAGAAGHQAGEQHDRNQWDAHLSHYTGDVS